VHYEEWKKLVSKVYRQYGFIYEAVSKRWNYGDREQSSHCQVRDKEEGMTKNKEHVGGFHGTILYPDRRSDYMNLPIC
jgi:hypothetical protein